MKDILKTLVNGILEIVKTYKGDWKENNPSSPNYIKNRTHWIDEEKINETVLNETILIEDEYAMFNTKLLLNTDRTYYVTLNGVEYICKPWIGYEDNVCIGNGNIYGGEGMGDLDYPFSCDSYYYDKNIYLNVNSGDEGEYHVVIKEVGMIETIHTLDEKYLPPMDGDFDKIVDSECLVMVDGEYMDMDGYLGTYPSPKVNDRIVLTVGDLTFEGIVRPTDDQYHIVVGNGTLSSERGDGVSNGEDFFIDFSAWGDTSITTLWFSNNVNIDYYAPVKILAYTDRIKNNLLSDLVGKIYIDGNDVRSGEIFNDYENNIAIGTHAHAEGTLTKALGDETHVEGYRTVAKGWCSHAEGGSSKTETLSFYNSSKDDIITSWNQSPFTLAYGSYSHAEGRNTLAIGDSSHAGGLNTKAVGGNAYAEGQSTQALGGNAHAEGQNTVAKGFDSHAEGHSVISQGDYSHAEGYSSNAPNGLSTVSDVMAYWENNKFGMAFGSTSHSEGYMTLAIGNNSHTEGRYTQTIGDDSHSEGSYSIAKGTSSHAEGYDTITEGNYAHAEGSTTHAKGYSSHAEGYNTYAYGSYSHAEGEQCHSSGVGSHAEGGYCRTESNYCHAEGESCIAYAKHSHVEGHNTLAGSECQHVQGKNNIRDDNDKYVHIVGNGSGVADELRSNAHTLDWNGNGWYQGNLYVGGTNQDDGNKVLSTANIYFDSDGNLVVSIEGITKTFIPKE